MQIPVANIKDYTEKSWFLGTDILENENGNANDLRLMRNGTRVCEAFETGGRYYLHREDFDRDLLNAGYSDYFIELVKEARRRGYIYLHFDCDIETKQT